MKEPVPGDIVTIQLFVQGIVERDDEGLYINIQQQNIRYGGEPVNVVAHAMKEGQGLGGFDMEDLEKQLEVAKKVNQSFRTGIGLTDEDFNIFG